MNQPNYNFAYTAGGLVNYVWTNTVTQSNVPGHSSNSSFGMTSSSGQTNQYGNQQNKSLTGNVNQNNCQQSNNGNNNTVRAEQKQ